MRGDISTNQNYGARTASEKAEDTTMCGYNLLKTARLINLIVGTALTVCCGIQIFNVFSNGILSNFGKFFLNFFDCIFGIIIMGSSFMMPCVKRNFFFLMTGVGKGGFNIFVGTLLFMNKGDTASFLMGWAMIASGCVFLFLSKVKNMSDEDLQRALSVYADNNKAAMKSKAKKLATDHKDVIAKVAYDNREHIA